MSKDKLLLGVKILIVAALIGSNMALLVRNSQLKDGLNKCLDLMVKIETKQDVIDKPEAKK